MPADSDREDAPRTLSFPPLSSQVEKVRAHHRQIQESEALARALDAGRISRDAAIEVRQLVDSVEQTDDQDEHRRLLEAALATSIHTVTLTVAALPFVGPDRWVEAWLGTEATMALAQSHKLRESADSEDFLELVGKAVEDLGLSTLAGRRIVTRLAGVSLPEAPVRGLSNELRSAQDALERELQALQTDAGHSHLEAWVRAQAAREILEGAVVVYLPTLLDDAPPAPVGSAHGCLCVMAGAVLVRQACAASH